jgi:hypothetical protein
VLELDDLDPDQVRQRGDSVFLSDASPEGEAIGTALRGRGFDIVEVPIAQLEARIVSEAPRVVIVDIAQPGALEGLERLHRQSGGVTATVLLLGDPARSAELDLQLFGQVFERPVDIVELAANVSAAVESAWPGPSRGTTSPSLEPPRLTGYPGPLDSEIPSNIDFSHDLDALEAGAHLIGEDTESFATRYIPARVSPELEQILAAAEQRVTAKAAPSSIPAVEEEADLILSPELLSALDEPIEPGEEDESRPGSTSGGTLMHAAPGARFSTGAGVGVAIDRGTHADLTGPGDPIGMLSEPGDSNYPQPQEIALATKRTGSDHAEIALPIDPLDDTVPRVSSAVSLHDPDPGQPRAPRAPHAGDARWRAEAGLDSSTVGATLDSVVPPAYAAAAPARSGSGSVPLAAANDERERGFPPRRASERDPMPSTPRDAQRPRGASPPAREAQAAGLELGPGGARGEEASGRDRFTEPPPTRSRTARDHGSPDHPVPVPAIALPSFTAARWAELRKALPPLSAARAAEPPPAAPAQAAAAPPAPARAPVAPPAPARAPVAPPAPARAPVAPPAPVRAPVAPPAPAPVRAPAAAAPAPAMASASGRALPPPASPTSEDGPPVVSSATVLGPGDAPRALARAVGSRASGSLAIATEEGVRRIVLHDGDLVTAGSSVPDETLLSFLIARGDIERDTASRLTGKLPASGRHAGAALIAHGHLGQDDLWPVLRAHAEWLIGHVVLIESGTCDLESEPPGRLKAEPNVFGGATGAEVFVETVRRVIAPDVALRRLGGTGARLDDGVRRNLLSECALRREEDEFIRSARGRSVGELVTAGEPEIASVLYAIVCLEVMDVLIPPSITEAPPAPVEDPLDEEAIRKRVRARLALVEDGDYFSILGISRDATSYEIRRAYLALRKAFEPSTLLTAATVDLMADVRLVIEVLDEAYEILREPHRRERYRRAIEAGPP